MNRILLLILGVATGSWLLHDLRSVAEPTTAHGSVAKVAAHVEPAVVAQPRCIEPAVMPGAVALKLPAGPAAFAHARTVTAVKYTVLVDDESPASDDTDATPAEPAKSAVADPAAIGRWITGLVDSLVRKPEVVTKSAPPAANHEELQCDGPAKQASEKLAQRNPHIAPLLAPIPSAPTVTTTEDPAENATPTETAKPDDTAKPADMEKPAVTVAEPDDAPATDAKPASTDAATTVATDKTDNKSTGKAETGALPKENLPTPISPAVKSPAPESPALASPAPLPPAAPPQAVAPAPARVAPVRRPLTPELVALSQRVRYALWMYQHQRLLNTGTNAPWEVMHRFVAFGAATEVLRDGPRGEPVNAIGWLLWGGRCNSQPLLVLNGGRPMAMVGVGVQGHSGQFLGMLAQSRVRPESPFELQGMKFTVRDLIEEEKLSCEANTELTFELIAMSYYLKSDDVWTARSGEQWSISRLISEEIKQPINGAACGGSHRLFGLSAAYKMRIAEGKPVDGEFLRAQKYIHAYQSYALGRLENRDGSFSTDWFRGPADNGDLDRKIQTTGHILEWLVFSLEDNQLRDPRIVRSVDFLATQILMHPNRAWSVGPFGHALHAIAIYQSRVFIQHDPRPQQQPAAQNQATVQPKRSTAPVKAAVSAAISSLPPLPKADPARPATHPLPRPSIGTPNAAAATAELQGPDLGVTR